MKTIFALIALSLSGCLVTGGLEYDDAKTGAKARIGISHEFKPKMRADHKQVKPLE